MCLNKEDINNLEYAFHNIRWGKNKVGEYVMHPATADDSPYFGNLVEQRMKEYQMFTSEETKAIIAEAGITLSTYESC